MSTNSQSSFVNYSDVVDLKIHSEVNGSEIDLVNYSPQMCPKGYTPEYIIAQAARTSFGKDLSDPKRDEGLINYLYTNGHTSPLEMCSVTFRIKVPKFVAIQILRHRTLKHSKVNEFSQRYAVSNHENDGRWQPSMYETSYRVQDKLNKQGSSVCSYEKKVEMSNLFDEAENCLDNVYMLYDKLIAAGCAKEIARFCLPMSEYTTLFLQFDLNNLTKFLSLRDDNHSQYETQQVAREMHIIAAQLFPTVFKAYENTRQRVIFSKADIEHISRENVYSSKSMSASVEEKLSIIKCEQSNVVKYSPPRMKNTLPKKVQYKINELNFILLVLSLFSLIASIYYS
jgi:thymidylate synthase (FAD)